MRFRVLVLALCGVLVPAFAQQRPISVDQLSKFIESSKAQKLPDKDVAEYLTRATLSEKLTTGKMEELQVQGPGPKTRAALEKLASASAGLQPPPPKAAPAPVSTGGDPPSEAEKKKAIDEAREWGLGYVKSLPNFICSQVTTRSVDRFYRRGNDPSWSPLDRMQEKLTFLDGHETYELVQVNDTATLGKKWETIGGSKSSGEFGSLIKELFEASTAAQFRWLRWGNIRGNKTHVYEYRVEKNRSKLNIRSDDTKQEITPGYHGLLYVQQGINVVLRVTVIPDIPPDFPIQDVNQMLDYGFVTVGNTEYLLPVHSEVLLRVGGEYSKNEIDFRQYKKYGADTTITFDTPGAGQTVVPDGGNPAGGGKSTPSGGLPDEASPGKP